MAAHSSTGPRAGELPAWLGNFQVTAILGEGATGTVYEARWGPRVVALKVLRAARDEAARRRFLAEAEQFRKTSHPSVVKVLASGELPDGRAYLAMERLHGEPLAARLARGRLSVEAAFALLDQIGGAVAALHAGGVVHRDVEPGNVFLIDDGRHAVLLDMGLAKEAGPDAGPTTTGVVRGTPAYMAPERLFGAPATPASDVYELALLFYTAVCGQPPWDDPANPEARLTPTPASERGVALPGRLSEALLEALSSRVEARPGTVAELLARLRAAAEAVATPAAPRPVRRRSRAVRVAVHAVLALVTGAAFAHASYYAIRAAVPSPVPYAGFVPEAPPACEAGTAAACRELAERYAFGDGVEPSFERAAALYRAACDHGDAEGCHMLGRMYKHGEGVEADDAEALARYTRACELSGGRWGCREEANLVLDGRGAERDTERGVARLIMACDGGDPAGCTNLGLLYARGEGVGNDDIEAARLWQLACDGDDATGCSNLGLFYRHGSGVDKDPARAVELYAKACELSNGSTGCANLGELYSSGVGVPKDDARAAQLFEQACDADAEVGCMNLAVVYAAGRGVLADKGQARALYRKACEMGHAPACNNLASMIARGAGGPRDDGGAVVLFERACDGGNGLGCSNLAVMREAGRGGAKDADAARAARERACELGHEPSCARPDP